MNITFLSRGTARSLALEEHITNRLVRISDYFGDTADCKVVYRKERKEGICEITITRRGDVFRCESRHEDIYVAANESTDNLWGKIRKYKTKIERTRRDRGIHKEEQVNKINRLVEKEDTEKVEIRHKKTEINTLSVEEAIDSLELVGHSFYIFINEETDSVSVVYKREHTKDGVNSYGVIETII